MIDEITGARGYGQHKGGGRAHANRRLQFLGNSHERAEPENLDHHDVVHKHRANQDEQIFRHLRTFEIRRRLSLDSPAASTGGFNSKKNKSVPLVGFELTTYRLQGGCSTNLAKAAWIIAKIHVSGGSAEIRTRD